MKKSLVLAMAMALGVTASAYAANPFSDVPAGHWAYDSVNKLAAAGIVDGYGDATFGGDRLMTRYEMAQIVAKAMAKGAKERNGNYGSALRSRLYVKGQINDDWSYTGRIENRQKFNNNVGDEDTKLNWAFVEGKLGAVDVRAGRTWIYLGDGNIYDETFDGIVASFGKDVKLEAVYGKPTNSLGWDYDKVWGASLGGKLDVLNLGAGYYKFDAAGSTGAKGAALEDNNIWQANARYGFGNVSAQ